MTQHPEIIKDEEETEYECPICEDKFNIKQCKSGFSLSHKCLYGLAVRIEGDTIEKAYNNLCELHKAIEKDGE